MLIRAVRPTLARLGVIDVLARPQLELFDATGKSVALAVPWSSTSEDTRTELANVAVMVGAFRLDSGSQDQVLLVVLPAGAYTCVISNRSGTGRDCTTRSL
jgi:hypothetical protein